MLKAMRTGSQSTVLKLALFGLLLMAMAGLAVLGGNQSMFKGFKSNTLASIGREKIAVSEFERILDMNLRQQSIPLSQAIKVGIPRHVLMAEVDGRLFYREAIDMGFQVDEKTAAKSIKALLKPFVEQGHMTEKDAFHRVLTNMGVSERQFVTGVKSEIASNTMLSLLKAGTYVPDQLVRDALRFKNEERQAAYFKIPVEDTVKDPDDAALKEYYTTVSKQYMLPEYRTFAVILLDKKLLGAEHSKPSADAAKQYFEEHKENYVQPEMRTIEQAVAKDEKTAKAIYDAAQKTSDLKSATAKEKATFVKEQTTSEKDMAVELSTAAFQPKTAGLLEPVKSPLGWHVMNVKKITPGKQQSFDDVKAAIEKELSQSQGDEALYQKASEIDDLIASGKTLSDIAKEYKIPEHVFTDFDQSGFDRHKAKFSPGLLLPEKILSQAFALDKGEASQLIETPDGGFLIVETRSITPSAEQPFESVRADVLKSWKAQQLNKAIDAKATEVAERLKKGDSFDALAQSLQKTPATTGFMARRAAEEKAASLDPNSLAALFSLEKIGDSTSTVFDNSIVVIKLAGRHVKETDTQSKEDVSAVRSLIARSFQSDIQDQYRNALIRKHNVQLNEPLMDELYNPMKADDTSAAE